MIICEQMIGFGYWVTLINYRRCRKGRACACAGGFSFRWDRAASGAIVNIKVDSE